MGVAGCAHRPPCPSGTSRFVCGQRTRTEDAVRRGLITQEAGASLLAKYRVPMSPIHRVVTAEHLKGPSQDKLL
jgi:hypothetical protein